jgi:hypothetical protein
MGAEPAGRESCRSAVALEVGELNGDVHDTRYFPEICD